MKWAITHKFHEYLLGHKCVAWTDNNPLSHLSTAKLGATEQRWVAELAVVDYTVWYCPGRSNKNANTLSSICLRATQWLVQIALGLLCQRLGRKLL